MADAHPAPGQGQTLIQSVQRALRLLDALERRGGAGPAKQLAREVMLPLPTTYHLLRTLAHEGLVRSEKGVYALTRALRRRESSDEKVGVGIQGWVDQLSHELGAAVYFVQYDEGEIAVRAVSGNPAAPPVVEWADFRATAHTHAAGQSLLRQLDAGGRAEHLARYPWSSLTPYTVPDLRALEERLDGLPRGLPVLEYQEYALGSACAAVPVTVGSAIGTLALSVPAARGGSLQPLATALRTKAERIFLSRSFAVVAEPSDTLTG
ncbi:helix-turn-helix domain-containing protein [Streptomyces sp. CC208A]|uniref:IclR family transcriptional regulator n=1 Tax=Streptomyces sp. CC208A TaxID=3044573 RepID=UPI0024A84844|nr:helix-turn-helix domain-containing protein [Streptomyces sp. CC208A]